MYECPCCGFEQLDFEPWTGDSPSDEICPCCGMHFGYYDAGRRDRMFYAGWRTRWMVEGHPWFSHSQPPPDGWSARSQVEKFDRLPPA